MMKKIYTFLITLFIVGGAVGQGCLPEGITFYNQEQIDNFQTNYPGCTTIEGDVIIRDDNIHNLLGLMPLQVIQGDLKVITGGQSWSYLYDLEGLNNLTEIGGDFIIGDTVWTNEDFALNSLSALENLSYIGGDFSISFADSLVDLVGLENLVNIGGDLIISDNYNLAYLTGLENLYHIGGDFIIYGSIVSLDGLDGLKLIENSCEIFSVNINNFNGLESLDSIGGDLYIHHNFYLNDFTGLNNLSFLNGDLSITHNSCTSLDGFEQLETIAGDLRIEDNQALISLSGLSNISSEGIENLSIFENSSLTESESQGICNYLYNPNGIVNIYSNNIGCNTAGEIANGCGFLLPCLPQGNYYFLSQIDVDNFPIHYNYCTNLIGDVWIGGVKIQPESSDIYDLTSFSEIDSVAGNLSVMYCDSLATLNGLNNISSIEGDLCIGHNTIWTHPQNRSLITLNGLEGIEFISGNLVIANNHSLLNFSGLNNLQSISGDLIIYSNDTLTNFSGLNSLTSIEGSLNIGKWDEYFMGYGAYGNPALLDISGVDNLQEIGQDLWIMGNTVLQDFLGINTVNSIGGNLWIVANDSLSTLIGLENITTLEGLYTGSGSIYGEQGNISLISLSGLDNLTQVSGSISLALNYVLSDLEALTNLKSIGGSFSIVDNDSLSSLYGLDNLSHVNGGLYIGFNETLSNLEALGKLESIGGDLGINFNGMLSDLYGLDHIEVASIDNLSITYNNILSTCEVVSICNYLAAPNGDVYIYENAPGCNSAMEVLGACEMIGAEENESEMGISIFPNPTHSTINIDLPIRLQRNTIMTISTTNGQQLITQNITEPQIKIDISHLPAGIYIVKVWNDKDVTVQKVIKQ